MRKTDCELKKGTLLLKNPETEIKGLEKSALLLCEHAPHASLALRLDIPYTDSLPQGTEELEVIKIKRLGGNKDNLQIFILHDDSMALGLDISNGLYLGGQPELESKMALIFGYTLWTGGDLQKEFLNGDWLLAPMEPKLLFDYKPEDIWKKGMTKLGGRYTFFSQFPNNLSLN